MAVHVDKELWSDLQLVIELPDGRSVPVLAWQAGEVEGLAHGAHRDVAAVRTEVALLGVVQGAVQEVPQLCAQLMHVKIRAETKRAELRYTCTALDISRQGGRLTRCLASHEGALVAKALHEGQQGFIAARWLEDCRITSGCSALSSCSPGLATTGSNLPCQDFVIRSDEMQHSPDSGCPAQ